MASFIMHTITGERFLKALENHYNITISEYEKNLFILGNLIPDSLKIDKTLPSNLTEEELTNYKYDLKTKIREEKMVTHFRKPQNENLCFKIPVISSFLTKYTNLVKKDITALGYMFHLYTDIIFFSELFPKTYINIDENGNETIYDKYCKKVRIIKTNQEVDIKAFWTESGDTSIYDDYTTITKILIDEFGVSFNKETLLKFANENFINPGIEEVSYEKIDEIINKTSEYIDESQRLEKRELKVFDEKAVKDFIKSIPERFIKEYSYILKEYLNIN